MYCSKCGVQNSDGATYCINCGNGLMEAVPGQVPPAVVPTTPKTCGLATASMVMGILSVFCVTWPICGPLAIIFGIIALVKISGSNGQLKGNGRAITGLVIPVVFIIVTPVLMAILMPALSKVKHIAQAVVCESNLKGLSSAMTVYMNDYEDAYPTPEAWCDLLMQDVDVSQQSLQCPSVPELAFGYAMNEHLRKLSESAVEPVAAGQLVVLFEADLGKNGVGGPDDLVLRHERNGQLGCNILFADGHVEFVTEDRIAELHWTVEE